MVSILALSVTYGATSPKGRGLGMAVKLPAQVPSDRFRQRLSLWESLWRVSA